MIRLFIIAALVFTTVTASGQPASVTPTPSSFAPTLKIDLSNPDASVRSGHLRVGGKNPQGIEINATSRYLTVDDKPWFPVMGEFHFARYPRQEWEEELLKMKAGGINVVSTYVFWIYHEEEEGKWNWSGNRDLRAFVELCKKHGLYCYPRLGPWAHGEVRNGGFPDWLLQKCGKDVRKDTEPYLSYVRTFYEQIARQLDGLLWKDGGPVIGIQLENELTNNAKHLLTLKTMARELGIDVPLYTITGWMRVQIPENEMLPVFGGYPDAFWSRKTEGWARESRVNYFFSRNRDDSTIGADLAKTGADHPSETMLRYPYGTVELGGGMQVSYRRRPVIEADDVAALALVKIGSGSNMQGYYMYHGGANEIGKLSTLQESRATKYPNDMPVINYDFQAPLGEYGQRRESYNALRIQHLFLNDFGSELAPMPMTLPEKQPDGVDDRDTLRWSARSDGKRGFIFINNYQRIETLPEHKNVQFALRLKDEIEKVLGFEGEFRKESEMLTIPWTPTTIPAQTYMIWPFNMELEGGLRLKYATAQPLCRVGNCYVFFAPTGTESEFAFDLETVGDEWALTDKNELERYVVDEYRAIGILRLKPGMDSSVPLLSSSGTFTRILLLTQEQARHAFKANIWGKDRLVISNAGLIFDGDTLHVQSRNPEDLRIAVYPPTKGLKQVGGKGVEQVDGMFETFAADLETEKISVEWKQTKSAELATPVKLDEKNIPLPPGDADFAHSGIWQVSIPKDALENVHKVFLRIDYVGDVGRAYIGDRLIDDDFYFGRVWEIELNRFAPEVFEKGMTLKILPLRNDAPIYIPEDRLPKFDESGEALEVRSITAEPEYEVEVRSNQDQ